MAAPADPVATLAALAEPTRRRLYQLLSTERAPLTRDEAAMALGVSRSVAAFHLDKLAELGLLEVEYRRPPGRNGPGAGRPAKRYVVASREIAVSVPERHYDVAASLLAEAVERADAGPSAPGAALRSVAREYGRAVGHGLGPAGAGREGLTERVVGALGDRGYEPRTADEVIALDNCPFHALAERHRALVCGMNRELIAGILEAMGAPESSARLDPGPGRCCVTVLVEP